PAASCWWYSTILSSLVDFLVPFASQSFLQNDRPAQMGRLLGIEPARVREAYGGAVDADEVDHGILPGLDDGSARLPARREHRGIEVAERPHRRLGAARADRTVEVLHHRVRLGPRPGRLAKLQRGLVRDADRPARSEEHEAGKSGRVDRERSVKRPLGGIREGANIVAEEGPEKRQHRG